MGIRRFRLNLLIVGISVLFLPAILAAETHHPDWTELLQQYVLEGVVDYQGMKKDEARLDRYLEYLQDTDPAQLEKDDQLAFYINGYNAYTVKLILDNFDKGQPPKSIRKIGGFFSSPWDISFAVLGGQTYSLDNIEHDIIRVQFKEPRIHFAVNCASQSCPRLISEAYEGEMIDRQLEQSTMNFLMDSNHNYLKGDTLFVSSLFKWYKEDFNNDPVSFFLAHSSPTFQERLKESGKVKLKYLDYDWSLNGKNK